MCSYEAFRSHLEDIFESWGSDVEDRDVQDLHEAMQSYLEDDACFKLYRYLPVNYYNIRNIETGMIHLSNIGLFNDVYEGLPVSDYDSLSGEQKRILAKMANAVCFSESHNNLLMWSHYADSHRGICVEYDIKQLKDASTFRKLFPVVYDEKRIQNCNLHSLTNELIELWDDLKKNNEHSEGADLRNMLPILLKKNSLWGYEKEWRLVYTLPQFYDDKCDSANWSNLLLKFDCITAVYCGERCDKEVITNLSEIRDRKANSFNLYKAKLSNDGYDLIFEKV